MVTDLFSLACRFPFLYLYYSIFKNAIPPISPLNEEHLTKKFKGNLERWGWGITIIYSHYSFRLLAPQELKVKSALPAPDQGLGPMSASLQTRLISPFTVEEGGEFSVCRCSRAALECSHAVRASCQCIQRQQVNSYRHYVCVRVCVFSFH